MIEMEWDDEFHPPGVHEQAAVISAHYRKPPIGIFRFLQDYRRLRRSSEEFDRLMRQIGSWKLGPFRFWRAALSRTAQHMVLNTYPVGYGRLSTADHVMCNFYIC